MEARLEYETTAGRRRVKHCPCGKDNKDMKFACFKGYEHYGHCHGCDKTFFPVNEGQSILTENIPAPLHKVESSKIMRTFQQSSITTIPNSVVQANVIKPNNANLIKWLSDAKRRDNNEVPFTLEQVQQVIKQYYIRGTNVFSGGVAFIYIDVNKKVRQIKLMAYSESTGKRIKEPGNILQIGKNLLREAGISNVNIVACFFGEHLLKGNNKDVYIFESEATAIYASIFFPDCICLATGGKNGCKWDNAQVFKVLAGRRIMLWPDIDAHDEWLAKAEVLKNAGLMVEVNEMLINNAKIQAKKNGIPFELYQKQKYDLRDILIYKDPQDMIKRLDPIAKVKEQINSDSLKTEQMPEQDEEHVIQFFPNKNSEIKKFSTDEYKKWFDTIMPPYRQVCLSGNIPIYNLASFVTGRLHHINAFTGYKDPCNRSIFIDQLQQIREILTG